jgi:hypothetical protein
VLQECYKSVTSKSRVSYKSVTSVFQHLELEDGGGAAQLAVLQRVRHVGHLVRHGLLGCYRC